MNKEIQNLWQKIQQSLLAIVPSIGKSFHKPAEEAQIKESVRRCYSATSP